MFDVTFERANRFYNYFSSCFSNEICVQKYFIITTYYYYYYYYTHVHVTNRMKANKYNYLCYNLVNYYTVDL